MTPKQRLSCRINVCTGGDPTEMFCARVYVQQHTYGGFWLPLGNLINIVFYALRRERHHVRATYLLQRRINGKAKATCNQSTTPPSQDKTQPTAPCPHGVENLSQEGGETMVQCKCCGQLMMLEVAIKREYVQGKHWTTAYFCGNACVQKWYINQLNTFGM